MTKSPSSTANATRVTERLKTSRPKTVASPEAAVLRERAAPHERTFVDGKQSSDPVANEMAEDAVRAMTSGEDETAAQRGDAAIVNVEALVDRAPVNVIEDDLDTRTTGEFDRAAPRSAPSQRHGF